MTLYKKIYSTRPCERTVSSSASEKIERALSSSASVTLSGGIQRITSNELVLRMSISRFAHACAKRDMLILSTSSFDVIRWIPPLNVTEAELDKALSIFSDALDETVRSHGLVE